jgi:hypothetical protein
LTVLNTLKRHPAFKLGKTKLYAPSKVMAKIFKAMDYFLKLGDWELHTFDSAVATEGCIVTATASLFGMDILPLYLDPSAEVFGDDVAINIGGQILYCGMGDTLVSWSINSYEYR